MPQGRDLSTFLATSCGLKKTPDPFSDSHDFGFHSEGAWYRGPVQCREVRRLHAW